MPNVRGGVRLRLARDAPLPADTAHLAVGPGFLKLPCRSGEPQLPEAQPNAQLSGPDGAAV